MPDDPTASGGSATEHGGSGAPAPGDANGPTVSPGASRAEDGDYRWHGPSPHSYPGAEAYVPYGQQAPYGPNPQSPYGPNPQAPYGANPQSPYGPNPQIPYGQQAPYGANPQSPYGPNPQIPYGQQAPYGPNPQSPYAWSYVPPAPPRAPLSPEERRRRTRRGLAFAAVLVIAIGAGIGIGAAIAPTAPATSATKLVNSAIAAVTKAGTYHYVERSTALGVPDDIAGDATPNGGRQVILQRCSAGTTYFHLRLVKGVVYFKGTRAAALDQLGVPATRAASIAGRWVKIVKADKVYSTLADGITTRSNISQLRGAMVPLSTKQAGSSIEVLGALSKTGKRHQFIGTAALVLSSATGRPTSLRGRASTTTGNHYSVAWTFSRYGEAVHVTAPVSAVPYASLHATTPPKNICG